MPTARTYEKYSLDGEPFKESGRMYVNVITPKGTKKVRWYTEAERARMDKAAGIEVEPIDCMNFNARHAFGFDEDGYITIYKGNPDEIERWADENHECTRRNLTFGWYTPSRLEIKNLPASITPIKLMWADIAAEGNKMRPHEEVSKIVSKMALVTEDSKSQFQGSKDTWLQKTVTIKVNKKTTSIYGDKNIHTMVDADENVYLWETGSKDIPVGTTIEMKMKVKDHKVLKGVNTTVVYYCKIVR